MIKSLEAPDKARFRKRKRRSSEVPPLPTEVKTNVATKPTKPSKRQSSSGVCEHVSDRYEKVGRVGQGTYGVVYKARDKQTGEYVALKRCIPHHEASDGFPLTTLREIHALRACSQHPNVVKLLSVAVSSTNGVFLAFEYCSQDLAQLLDAHYPKFQCSPFDESHVKSLLQQLMSALKFCHSRSLIHRDIKPSNLLYNGGKLKLADFGLSRHVSTTLTPNVVSLWYRAPELLLQKGFATYTTAIDMWAVGCVLAELLQGCPLLDGRNELEQMEKMAACLGTPPYGEFRSSGGHRATGNDGVENVELWDRFGHLPNEGLSLLTRLLEYRPERRWTAAKTLTSEYFHVQPKPATEMPFLDRHQSG